ncbi:hypothetical protein MUK42_11459 [Musa troglodytarum]|uniref:Uncharacterized protein n=1 Tax=Musa troglodytarum TaxID=320322 RepID=A0A9E7GVS9_9LILI|nr:hypothetical protein MUK42_11459 [Musa troglodytarum]
MWRTHLGNYGDNVMSAEEQTIRAELETDIERNLEEELKDDICRLTASLHRLYRHKKNTNDKLTSSNDNGTEVTTVVKITTKTVGEYMMQIYESKTTALDVVSHCSSQSKAMQGRVHDSNKQTEWAGSTVAAGKKHGSGKSPNVGPLKKEGRGSTGTYGLARHYEWLHHGLMVNQITAVGCKDP